LIPLVALGGLESFLSTALEGLDPFFSVALGGLDPFFDPADGGLLPAWEGGLFSVSGLGDLAEVGRELGFAEVGLDPALEPMDKVRNTCNDKILSLYLIVYCTGGKSLPVKIFTISIHPQIYETMDKFLLRGMESV
jgi:hypothetical protein